MAKRKDEDKRLEELAEEVAWARDLIDDHYQRNGFAEQRLAELYGQVSSKAEKVVSIRENSENEWWDMPKDVTTLATEVVLGAALVLTDPDFQDLITPDQYNWLNSQLVIPHQPEPGEEFLDAIGQIAIVGRASQLTEAMLGRVIDRLKLRLDPVRELQHAENLSQLVRNLTRFGYDALETYRQENLEVAQE